MPGTRWLHTYADIHAWETHLLQFPHKRQRLRRPLQGEFFSKFLLDDQFSNREYIVHHGIVQFKWNQSSLPFVDISKGNGIVTRFADGVCNAIGKGDDGVSIAIYECVCLGVNKWNHSIVLIGNFDVGCLWRCPAQQWDSIRRNATTKRCRRWDDERCDGCWCCDYCEKQSPKTYPMQHERGLFATLRHGGKMLLLACSGTQ